MKKMKRLISLTIAVICAFNMTACKKTTEEPKQDPQTPVSESKTPDTKTETPKTSASTEATGKKELVFAQMGMKAVLDRTFVTYNETSQVVDRVFEGLMENNPYLGEIVPVLAEDFPEVSADQKEYTFKIKKGIKFHDGEELKASDVKYSFVRRLSPETAAIDVEDYMAIKGAQDFIDGKVKELSGVEVIDEYTVKITTDDVFSLFLPYISTMPIYPEKACTEAGDDWGLSVLVGTGPFKLESHDMDTGVRLIRNEDYHNKDNLPKIDSVYYKYYQDSNTMLLDYEAGNIDAMTLDATFVDQYKNDAKFSSHLKSFPTFGHYFVVMNFSMEPWSNPKVREAFSYAIDVDAICNDLLGGVLAPASVLLGSNVMGHDSSVPVKQYDVEKSKSLLAEAGYPNGVDVEFVTTNLESTGGKMIIAMQSMSAPAGFNLKPTLVDRAAWTDIRDNGQVPAFIGNWYLGVPEADGMLFGFFHSSTNSHFSSLYVNDTYDKLVESARLELDADARSEIYKKADHMLVAEDFVTVPIGWPVQFYLSQPWLVDFEMANNTLNPEKTDIDLSIKGK